MANTHVCPWWSGFTLNWRARQLIHPPVRMLAPYLKAGMTALDIGSGMGYFTLPMAELVGESGRVIAVDMQSQMLSGMLRRAEKGGVQSRIVAHQCAQNALGLGEYTDAVDFALAFMMVHEVPDQDRLMAEIYAALRPGGLLLFAEPIAHVRRADFERSAQRFARHGFRAIGRPRVALCRAVLWQKEPARQNNTKRA